MLGWQNYRLQQAMVPKKVDRPSTLSVQDNATRYVLEPAATASDAVRDSSVSVLIDSDRLSATLSAEGLPAIPSDRVYALWTVVQSGTIATTDAKNAILTATFTVAELDSAAQIQTPLPRVFQQLDQVEKLAITIELAQAPQKHEADPILLKSL